MIEEVLKDIRDAEQKADEIKKAAEAQSKTIVLEAEIEAEAQKKATVFECRADIKKAVAEAEKKAAERRASIIAEGEKAAADFTKEKQSEVVSKSDEILELLIKKYGA